MLISLLGATFLTFSCIKSQQNKIQTGPPHQRSYKSVDGGKLQVHSAQSSIVRYGDYQSARLSLSFDNSADYVEYQAYHISTEKPVKNGTIYLGESIIHDLPPGHIRFTFKACAEARFVKPTKSPCGSTKTAYHHQRGNQDQKLKEMLLARDAFVKKQQDKAVELDQVVRSYKMKKDNSDKDWDQLAAQVEYLGPGKMGDTIIKADLATIKESYNTNAMKPATGAYQLSQNNDSDDDDDDDDADANSLSLGDGLALIYLAGLAMNKYQTKVNREKVSNDYDEVKNIFDDLNKKQNYIKANMGKIAKYDVEISKIENSNFIVKKQKATELENLKKFRSSLRSSNQKLDQELRGLNSKFDETLANKLENVPKNRKGAWIKKLGVAVTVVGAAVIIFTGIDENIMRKANNLMEKTSFELANSSAPSLQLRNNFARIENDILSIKKDLSQLDEKIWQHIQNLQ